MKTELWKNPSVKHCPVLRENHMLCLFNLGVTQTLGAGHHWSRYQFRFQETIIQELLRHLNHQHLKHLKSLKNMFLFTAPGLLCFFCSFRKPSTAVCPLQPSQQDLLLVRPHEVNTLGFTLMGAVGTSDTGSSFLPVCSR